jgi:type IV pilus biogenesis protein CpaD/CtpE
MAQGRTWNGMVAAVLAAALAGCAPYIKDFYSEAPPEAKAELVQVTYNVPFRPDEQYMSDARGRALDEFLSMIGTDVQQDRVMVLDRDNTSPWAAQRLESVRAYLAARRIPAEAGRPAPDVPSIRDTVSVVVERVVLANLDCPNWTQPRGGNPENSTHRNFGCADAFNLQQMVANKRDLVVGQALAPTSDGEYEALQIQRYRRDVAVQQQPPIKPLARITTSSVLQER